MMAHKGASRRGSWFRSLPARGQTLVLVALVMPVVLGFAALATDIAVFYVNWFALQKGVDSAVLSGAAYLPDQTAQAISTADTYANNNAILSSEITSVTIGSGNTSITMTAQRTVPFYFARIFGIPSGVVKVLATASIVPINQAMGVVPLGIDWNDGNPYPTNSPMTLHPGMVPGPGNWQSLVLGSSPGTNAFINNVENGYNGTLAVGDMITTLTGNDPHNIALAINYRINEAMQDPTYSTDTSSNYLVSDPRLMLVPMVNFAGINGSSQVPLMGFAEVWVNSVGSDGSINVTFLDAVPGAGSGSATAPNFGAYTPELTQ